MPKQSYVINKFLGLNTEADARDIQPGQLQQATNVLVDKPGKIRSMPIAGRYNTLSKATTQLNPGYGLFAFSADYSYAATPAATRTNYIVAQIGGSTFEIIPGYDSGSTTWYSQDTNNNNLDIGTQDSNVEQNYYYVDGALRICDGNFAAANISGNSRKWLGYINQLPFGSAYTQQDWYIKDADITAPSEGIVYAGDCWTEAGSSDTILIDVGAFAGIGTDILAYKAVNASDDVVRAITARTDDQLTTAAGGAWAPAPSARIYYIAPAGDGTGICINLYDTGAAGGIPAGTYNLATTFIYDKSQESTLFKLKGSAILSGNIYRLYAIARGEYNPRITGGRIYIREDGSGDKWAILAEWSMEDGVWAVPQGEGYALASWTGDVTSNNEAEEIYVSITSQDYGDTGSAINAATYEMITGLGESESILNAKYKTSCIINRRCYIGNIYQDGIHYGDRMLKSPFGKFDIFPSGNYVDVAIEDGDDIIKLIAFGDRILQFKRRILYIINVSKEEEFVEEIHPFKGIDYPCQVYEGSDGIIWANQIGVFYYDGQKIHDLSEPIKSDWQDFAGISGAIFSVGFEEQYKKAIILKSVKGLAVSDDDIYCFDFISKQWTYGSGIYTELTAGYGRTNFVNTADGELICLEYDVSANNFIMKWQNNPTAITSMSMKTQDIDFGKPGINKRIYGIYITYKCVTTANVSMSTYYDGGGTPTNAAALTSTGDVWQVQEFSITPVNIKSVVIRLYSTGTVPSTFEVNDITIIYRMKGDR